MIAGISDIAALSPDAGPEAKRAAFERVAESFEAVFISQLIRGLRESFCKEFMGGSGFGKEIYASWFDQAFAEAMAKGGGIGVKDQLQRWVFPEEIETSPSSTDQTRAAKPLRLRGRF
jgi:Rod binding domain-containing protein